MSLDIENTAESAAETENGSFWERNRARIFAVAILTVVALSALALSRMLDDVVFDDLVAVIETTSWKDVVLALAFTAVSFAALSIYDRQALALVGRKAPYSQIALTSFCAYAVGNIAGFGPLTGGTIRYRFYSPLGVSPEDIARIIAYVTAAFGFGLLFVGGLGLAAADARLAALVGLPAFSVRAVAILILALVGATFIAAAVAPRQVTLFGRSIALPGPGALALQLGATLVDLIASALVLWVLLPPGSVDFPTMLSVYAVAVGLGILSHVPGGVGIFETVILGALGSKVPLDGLVGALLLYRVIYYVVPLVVAVIALTVAELRRAAAANVALARGTIALVPVVLSTFAVVLGAMLVFSGVTPTLNEKLDWLQAAIPLPVVEAGHFIASIIGLLMIFAGRGLVHRLDGAWWMTIVLAGISIVLAFIKGFEVGEALLLSVLVGALLLTRNIFNRPAALTQDRLSPGWWLCIGVILALGLAILFFVYKEVDYSHELWWQFEFGATAPRSLRAALGVGLTAGAVSVWLLTRPPTGKSSRPGADELCDAVAVVENQPIADANLVRMGDKSLLFSAGRDAFLMYGKRGRSWIALYDPIGNPDAHEELVWRFVELARRHGGRAVFYEVPAESLAMYADAGLSAFKLGEEARVRLETFDLKGSKRASIRTALNKADRDGIVFEVLSAEQVGNVLDQLERVSSAWLAEHAVREKGFSLGAFERGYITAQPVAVLKQNGRILAFANILITALKEEATVDLMRFHPDAPKGSMEVLFARLLLHFKQEGYQWFTLGMAPLAGLSENPAAPMWHRVGRAAFDHGEAFYNFRGLRAFKNKFDPVWSPRYMAVAGGLNPLLAIADVTVLISGGIRGVIAK
ncbi:bifunctional lysylphosphatidylglycerol flippase/synthetase MprF [Mesorhizobium sp. BAC0120]|uniref:bifunctional lysylphosphatidylglycerol flippase/synthetase MprF n=1 Tax=Mesorhizobium sp. BAC0120 TaxID=3090670 RepID=UPI00298CB1C4|nr:bifunctional lysylphosphatidylglycerol flippase/synthetase MprF [Mesorhizobium sp. BAC0120]MDW6020214.1 bifunctional lysylphosphatidylglycerol flippase/synthetase MprF [Mesorhizobium sp. BAC0120]